MGDPPGGVYGLIEGTVRMEHFVQQIGTQVAFIAHPGFWIGVASAVRRAERELALIAATDAVLFYLPLSGFDLLAQDPGSLRHFAILTADNNTLILDGVRDLLNPDITARIASRLLAIVGSTPRVTDESSLGPVTVTQSELAMICNVSRKTINQELAKLAERGLVTRAYGSVVVNDPAGLRRVSEGHPTHPAQPTSNAIDPV